ncbi:hypothetical protein QQF64_024617 [Cirrhinus molitorella]|uniref:Uncharacterized protein n=1 Tax=Cirrhinus molitorella TaxID=172907 RepID=A0ABR3NLY0_9TELE
MIRLSVHHTFGPTGRCPGAEAPCGWQVTFGEGRQEGRGWTGAGKEREGGLKCTGDITFKVQRKGEDSFRTISSPPPTLHLIHSSVNLSNL